MPHRTKKSPVPNLPIQISAFSELPMMDGARDSRGLSVMLLTAQIGQDAVLRSPMAADDKKSFNIISKYHDFSSRSSILPPFIRRAAAARLATPELVYMNMADGLTIQPTVGETEKQGQQCIHTQTSSLGNVQASRP